MCGLGSYAFWMDMYVSLCDKRCNVICLDECVCVCVCVCVSIDASVQHVFNEVKT